MYFPSIQECSQVTGPAREILKEFEGRVHGEYVNMLARVQDGQATKEVIAAMATTLLACITARVAMDALEMADVDAQEPAGDDIDAQSYADLSAQSFEWARKRAGKEKMDKSLGWRHSFITLKENVK